MMSDRIQEINSQIDDLYNRYKKGYAQLTDITNSIKSLEDERGELVESDGRRFLFKKTAAELKEFISYVKGEKWISLEYEGFEVEYGIRNDIIDEAMLVSIYCYQPNYSAPVKFIVVFDSYVNKDEYEILKRKYNLIFEYYRKGEGDAEE